MAQLFTRTLRSLDTDRAGRYFAGLGLAALLLGAWCGWFFFARLAVYALSSDARLEVECAAYPVEAPVSARLEKIHVVLGDEVGVGQLLFELEPSSLNVQLAEEGEHVNALAARREALEAEIASLVAQRELADHGANAGLAEARARHREARAAAQQADAELARLVELRAAGLTSEVDVERARSMAAQRWAATEALELAGERQAAEARARQSELEARREQLRQELTRIAAEIAGVRAHLAELEHLVAERTLGARVAGRIGQLAELNPGAVVQAGQRLATIIPPGEARGVAYFSPAETLGRIRPGQRARLRLTGFPATQYGSLPATVTSVGSEVSQGRVRVELAITVAPATAIPLEHGLPGTVEVELERVSPATLVLRAAGRAVVRSPASRPSPPGRGEGGT